MVPAVFVISIRIVSFFVSVPRLCAVFILTRSRVLSPKTEAMDPFSTSCDSDGGGGRHQPAKPVIPPKPEGYGTLGRQKGERDSQSNGSADQNRLSYASNRPQSTEILTDPGSYSTSSGSSCSAAGGANPATRQSPRSPRAKPPAPPVPSATSSICSSSVGGGGGRPLPPPPLSLAESQGLAGLALDCPCPLPTLAGNGTGKHHASAFEPQLSVWNPLIEPPQLFQTTMDVDLAFDSGNVDLPEPLASVPPPPQPQPTPVIISKPAPPPPSSFQSMLNMNHTEPIKPVKMDPPRLPSVPPVATSLSLNLNIDPLTRPLLPKGGSGSEPDRTSMLSSNNKAMAGLPMGSELNKLFIKPNGAAAPAAANTVDPLPPPVRMEPRVTTDLVRLEQNTTKEPTSLSTPTESSGKPSRVLPLKPFPDPPQSSAQQPRSVDRQSLESIHSNPSTIDTTDSPRSLPSNETISTRNALNVSLPNGRAAANGGVVALDERTASSGGDASLKPAPAPPGAPGPAPPPPLLLPAPHPPPPPPPSSYMTIDIDPAANGEAGGEKVVDFYPPNSFIPYSFHSECWHKEIPENETKWEMYKRRFLEFVFNFTACCIRCIGPV